MTEVALLSRVVLAAVFVASAVAKLRDRPGSRQAVSDFGVPQTLAPAVAAVLPFVELLCAALLLTADPGATLGALGSVVLLLAFTAGIVINLVQGRRPDCHCFGQFGGSQIGWLGVARNVTLLVLAGLALTGDGASVPSGIASYDARELAIGGAVALAVALFAALSAVVYHLLKRYGAVLLRLEALERASGLAERPVAPDFELPDLDGNRVSLSGALAQGLPVLVAFISPGCTYCGELIPYLAEWQLDPDPAVTVLVVSTGSVEANREKIGAAPGLQVLLQDDWETYDAYRMEGTPGAVVVAVDGRIAVPSAYTVSGVRSLYDDVLAVAAEPHSHDHDEVVVHPGDPLPAIDVGTESGERLPIAQAADDAILLFWRTDCSYCGLIVHDVAALEKDTHVLIVTDTPSDTVRASGLTGSLIRQDGSLLSDALGVPGTPSALRIRNGSVDSELAMGGPAVLSLLRESARSDVPLR